MAAFPGPTGCGDGLTARHAGQANGSTVPSGAAARFYFGAPPGTAIAGVTMTGLFQTKAAQWQSVLSNGSQVLVGCERGQAPCSRSLNNEFVPVPSSSVVYTEVFCPVGPCPAYWQPDGAYGYVFARSIINSVWVLIRDPTFPTVDNGRGVAWGSSWLSGAPTVTFDAADGSGISLIRASVDGTEVNRAAQPCDDYQLACPNWPGASLEVNTRLFRDGRHSLVITAYDRAGNPTAAQRDVRSDNTPPEPPSNLASNLGSGWTAGPPAALTWSNAPQEFAPLTGATVRACPAGQTTGCVTKDYSGAGLDHASYALPKQGLWDVSVWLRDAAGNASEANATEPLKLGLDTAAPTDVAFAPLDPDTPSVLHVRATDALSGVAGGDVEIRRKGQTAWLPLTTSVERAGIRAALPDGRLADGRYELRARVVDAAGNERSTTERSGGAPATVRLPVRVKTQMIVGRAKRVHARTASGRRHVRTIYVRHPIVRHGRLTRMGGRLVSPGGNPIAGAPVEVSARTDAPGSTFAPVATLTTGRRGRFSYSLPPGPSRIVRFIYRGGPRVRPQLRRVRVRVLAASMMRADRHRVVTGESVRFTGRVTTRPIPSTGKLVELQYFDRGSWRTFRTVHAAASDGRWRFSYRFTGTVGSRSYRFRAHLPRENGYPYAAGASRAVRVTVRGL